MLTRFVGLGMLALLVGGNSGCCVVKEVRCWREAMCNRYWSNHLPCDGCGEVYWHEWFSDPPDCCDPCDCYGNFGRTHRDYCPYFGINCAKRGHCGHGHGHGGHGGCSCGGHSPGGPADFSYGPYDMRLGEEMIVNEEGAEAIPPPAPTGSQTRRMSPPRRMPRYR